VLGAAAIAAGSFGCEVCLDGASCGEGATSAVSSSATVGGSGSGGSGSGTGTAGGSSGTSGGTASASSGSSTGVCVPGGTTGSAGTGGRYPDGGQCTADTWCNFAMGFFGTYCASCHEWAQTYDSVSVYAAVAQSHLEPPRMMPPSYAPQPSDEDVQRILTWIACGLPQ